RGSTLVFLSAIRNWGFSPQTEVREDSRTPLSPAYGAVYSSRLFEAQLRGGFRGGRGAGLPASGPFSGHHSDAATRPRHRRFAIRFLVGGTGLEPVTSAMSTLRSNQLS